MLFHDACKRGDERWADWSSAFLSALLQYDIPRQNVLITAHHRLTFCHVPFTSYPIAQGTLRWYWRGHLYDAATLKLCGALPDAKGRFVRLGGTGSAGIKTSIPDEPGLRMGCARGWHSCNPSKYGIQSDRSLQTSALLRLNSAPTHPPSNPNPAFPHTHIFAHRSNIDKSSCPLAVWVYLSNSLESGYTPRLGALRRKLRECPVCIRLTQTHAVRAHRSPFRVT